MKESLTNLMTFPWVKDSVLRGALTLHGWYFDLGTGTLHIMDSTGAFKAAEG